MDAAGPAEVRGTYDQAQARAHPDDAYEDQYRGSEPRISHWNPAHTVYPYLLRDLTITRSDHVWAADITYIR
jgi:hypothetical protein